MRLTPEQRATVEQLPPDQQAAARESATATARASLLAKVDQAASPPGESHPDAYHELLEGELSTKELAVADDRIALGRASDLHQVEVAGEGIGLNALGFEAHIPLGADRGRIYDLLGDKTPSQMQTIANDFKGEHPEDDFLEHLVGMGDSPGMKRDFKILAEGNYARMSDEDRQQLATQNPLALIERVNDLEDAARGGLGGLFEPGNITSNTLADRCGNAGARVKGRVSRVDEYLDKIKADEPLTDEDRQDLLDQERYMYGDQKAFSATKSAMVNTGAEGLGTVADVGITTLTGEPTLGSVAGGVVRSSVKSTFDPGRYGHTEQYRDFVQTGTDVTGNAISATYGETNPFRSQIGSGIFGGVAQGIADPRAIADGSFVEKTATGVLEQTTSSVATGGMESVLGNGVVSKMAQSGVRTLATGDLAQGGGELGWDTFQSSTVDYLRTRGEASYEAREANTPRHVDSAAAADLAASPEPTSTVTGSADPAPIATDASAIATNDSAPPATTSSPLPVIEPAATAPAAESPNVTPAAEAAPSPEPTTGPVPPAENRRASRRRRRR